MTDAVNTGSWVVYRRLLSYVKPFYTVLFIGMLANIVYALIDAGLTYLLRPFLDKGLIELDMTFVRTIPWIILLGVTVRGMVSALGGYCMTWVARMVVMVLRQTVFRHLHDLPKSYYDTMSSGEILSRLLYDVEQVAVVSADALTDFLQNIFLVLGLLTVMFVICWQLSLMFLLTIPVIGYIVIITNKRVRRLSKTIQQNMGDVTHIASESIEGFQTIRVFGGQAYEINKFNQATLTARQNDMKVAVSKALNVTGVQAVIALGMALIICASIQLSKVIVVSPGSFIAVIAAMIQLIKPMKTLTTLNATIQRGLAGAHSVFHFLDEPLEQTSGLPIEKRLKGDVLFEDVRFYYHKESIVLDNLSFCIPKGKTVALVGHSGSGKTSIVNLLLRFYSPQSGRIIVDNVAIQDYDLLAYRKQISLVSQQITLFNDSIRHNIAYGESDIPMDKIIAASKMAFAHDFIESLPEGYDTRVGENGFMLSGGQRQRIAIARAILKDAPLFILDEATSALDNTSEQYIQNALLTLMKNRTTLVIAHRLSTILHADNILVMDKGRIVEAGTHDVLMDKQGYYAALFKAHDIVMDN